MAFHRYTQPSYPGNPTLAAPPGAVSFNGTTYDFLNVVSGGVGAGGSAMVDGYKTSGPNTGTYLHAFAEDATSLNFNRGLVALAENCDFIDDILNDALAMPTKTNLDTAVGAVSTITLPAATFVGDAISYPLAQLFVVVDDDDRAILNGGVRVEVASITGASIGDGFSSGSITLNLGVAIPNGTQYRVYYNTRSKLAGLPVDAYSLNPVAAFIPYTSSSSWADSSTLLAGNVEQALDEVVSVLGATGGSSLLGYSPSYALSSATVKAALDDLDYRLLKGTLVNHSSVLTPPGNTNSIYQEVAYANSKFVAVTDDGLIVYSSDGLTWSSATPDAGASEFYGLVYGNSKFVAVGTDIETSAAGSGVWTQVFDPPEAGGKFVGVTYGNTLFVAVGYQDTGSLIYTSADGTTWASASAASATANFYDVAYGSSKFVAVGVTAGGAPYVESSSSGTSGWTARTLPGAPGTADVNGIAYGNGVFVLVGSNGLCYSSTNGTAWTARTVPITSTLYFVRYVKGVFIAGGSGNLMISKDGVNWELVKGSYSGVLRSVAASSSALVLGSAYGSSNGATELRYADLSGVNNALADVRLSTGAKLVGFTATGTIASTNVQDAIAELGTEKAALSGAAFSGTVSAPSFNYSPSRTVTRVIPGAAIQQALGAVVGQTLWNMSSQGNVFRASGANVCYGWFILDEYLIHGATITDCKVYVHPNASRLFNANRMQVTYGYKNPTTDLVYTLPNTLYDDGTAAVQDIDVPEVDGVVVNRSTTSYAIRVRSTDNGDANPDSVLGVVLTMSVPSADPG